MDPVTLKILLKIGAAIFALNEVSKSISSEKSKVERQNEEIEKFRREELSRIDSQLESQNRYQKIKLLRQQKDNFVEISNRFFNEKQNLFKKIQANYALINEINKLKSELYTSKRHSEIEALKEKTNELYSLTEDVKKQFADFETKVKSNNQLVQDIKKKILELKG